MFYFLCFVFYLIGWFVCSFSIGNIILLLFFSIPFTRKLYNGGAIVDKKNRNSIIKLNIISTIIQLIIFAIIVFVIYRFFNSYLIAFLIGMVIPFFVTISQINSPNNAADYFKTYGKYINLEQVVNGDDK